MNEFFNWNDTTILLHHNWFWMLVSAGVGAWAAWRTCDPTPGDGQ